VDDELDLLPEQQDLTPSRRPIGLLVGALVAVALLAVAGVFWLVIAVAGRSGTVTAAGASSPAPSTAAPTTPPATTAAAETVPPPTATFSLPAVPVRSAATVVPPRPSPTPAPRPVPNPTVKPVPTPRPTLSTPVGKLVPVPGVIGLRVARASTELRTAGFRVQVVGGVLDPDRDDRRVVAQRPTPGSVVLAGSTVILVTDGT
jgi:hypothetical protein